MKKAFNLFMAILMATITTFIILWFFFSFEESDFGWGLITMVSILGYMVSVLYLYNYKKKIG
jgi:drug/metabolite transporter (DMT)-like permease